MNPLSWLRPAARRPVATVRRPSFRPRLDRLDDRSLPSVSFATALPGAVYGTAADAAGDTYVTTANGSTYGVYKFDTAGRLLASNPSVPAGGGGIAVDAAGDVYLHHGALVTELDPTLQRTLFSVTLPGVANGRGSFQGGTSWYGAIAVAGGKIYVDGTAGAGLPTTAGAFQPTYPGYSSAYLGVIDPAAGPSPAYYLTYCTYLGGSAGGSWATSASGIAVDAAGAAYLTGTTAATNFPTTPGAVQSVNHSAQGWTVFAAKLDPAQTGAASLAYSTYLGGSGKDGYVQNYAVAAAPESSPSVAVDASGAAYITGSTTSADFPTTAGAVQRTFAPDHTGNFATGHAFVSKLTPAGTGLAYSTFLGGSQTDGAGGIAVDAAGDAWVTGWTRSADFPVTAGAVQPHLTAGAAPAGRYSGPNSDAFVTELDPAGGSLKYSTFWGGAADEFGVSVGLDAAGGVSVGGSTSGQSAVPTTPGAYLKSGLGFALKLTP